MDEKLLEPLKYYKDEAKQIHSENTEKLFDSFVEKSKIDVELNRSTVKKYKEKLSEVENSGKTLSRFKLLKTASIVVCVILGILFVYNLYQIISGLAAVKVIIIAIISLAACVAIIVLLKTKIAPKIANVEQLKKNLENEANDILNECYSQMAPLNALYDSDDARNLLNKTIPDLILDKNFNIERFEYLNEKFGLTDNTSTDVTSLKLLSGEIIGNPYVIVKELEHELGTYTYEGTLTIHWDTYYYDSKGNRVTEHHSQVLHAYLKKPKPYYSEYTTLIYGNEAAPNLTFSRKPGHIEKMSDKQFEKHIKKGSKELLNIQRNSISNGGNFTPLGNDEFDVSFGAYDRDNEPEFRLLFTPLAQKNMVDLLRNGMYGDDFHFTKRNKLNYITGEDTYNWNLDTFAGNFKNYDVDAARSYFKEFHSQYFDHFYFQFAPLLSIPLYQQHKTAEYIYKHKFNRNYTSYVAESVANVLAGEYSHPDTKTRSILKTSLVSTDGETDVVRVDAYSYDAINRTDYVSVYGGDGNYHDVPVNWVEYIPLQNSSYMKLKDTNVQDSKYLEMRELDSFNNMLNNNGIDHYAYENGMMGFKTNDASTSIDAKLNDYFKNFISKKEGE